MLCNKSTSVACHIPALVGTSEKCERLQQPAKVGPGIDRGERRDALETGANGEDGFVGGDLCEI